MPPQEQYLLLCVCVCVCVCVKDTYFLQRFCLHFIKVVL